MAVLPDAFFQLAKEWLATHPHLSHEWCGPEKDGKRILRIPKLDNTGFDVEIQCETYGLYPFCDGWHGAPWDAPHDSKTTCEEICADCLRFVGSTLDSNATLTVWYASGKPYKWVLSYPWGGQRTHDDVRSLFFNFFGRREQRMFQNRHLQSRETRLQPNNRSQGDAQTSPELIDTLG